MSNIAVSTLAMKAAVVGIEHLGNVQRRGAQQSGFENNTYRFRRSPRALSERAGSTAHMARAGFSPSPVMSLPALV